jgi:hypothetical protein
MNSVIDGLLDGESYLNHFIPVCTRGTFLFILSFHLNGVLLTEENHTFVIMIQRQAVDVVLTHKNNSEVIILLLLLNRCSSFEICEGKRQKLTILSSIFGGTVLLKNDLIIKNRNYIVCEWMRIDLPNSDHIIINYSLRSECSFRMLTIVSLCSFGCNQSCQIFRISDIFYLNLISLFC